MLVTIDNAELLEGLLKSPTLKNLYDLYLEERYIYHTTRYEKEGKQKSIVVERVILEKRLEKLAFSMLEEAKGTTVSKKWTRKSLKPKA